MDTVIEKRASRAKPIVHHQENYSDRYSLCGLFSINNALQKRDFLTIKSMEEHVDALGSDHGDKTYGAYSTQTYIFIRWSIKANIEAVNVGVRVHSSPE